MRRVAVTGMGMVTPIGSGKEEFWQGLLKGRSGIRKVTAFDAGSYPCQIAGEVPDFDPARYMEKREAKKMDRFTQFGAAAALMAWRDAGLDRDEIDRDAAGVFVGSGIGGIRTIEEQYSLLLEKGPRRVSPFLVPALIANMAAGYISILLLLRGPNSTAATACASSNHAVGDAYRVIQRGEAEIMVAGGAEAAISEIAFAGFCSARALSTRNDEPAQASRPLTGRETALSWARAPVLSFSNRSIML